MPILPIDTNDSPNYTPAQHADHHNILHAFNNDHPTDPAAHSGTYVAADQTVSYAGAGWVASRGSPVLSAFGSGTESATPAFAFDAAASETVVLQVAVPDGAGTVDIDYWWMNAAGGGAGDVVWSLEQAKGITDGGTRTSDLGGAAIVTVTAPPVDTFKKTTIKTGYPIVAGVRWLRLAVNRRGNDAADTLANDAGLIAVVLRKAS